MAEQQEEALRNSEHTGGTLSPGWPAGHLGVPLKKMVKVRERAVRASLLSTLPPMPRPD